MPWADASRATRVDEPYTLFHGADRVGGVVCDGGVADFPQHRAGTLTVDEATPARVREFLELSREHQRLLAAGRDAALLTARQQSEYADLVNSTAWRLVDALGRDAPILCPLVLQGDVLLWVRADGKEWGADAEPGAASDGGGG